MKNIRLNFFYTKKMKEKHVPKSLFAAYLQGGRIWPQKRWSTNIFVLDELSKLNNPHNPYNQKDLKIFLNSTFAPQQLQNVRLVMDQDHLKGEIHTPGITDTLLNSQWLKTKVGSYRMFRAFSQNKPPEYYNESDYSKLLHEIFTINENFNINLSLEERLFIKSAINFTKNTILKHRELSRMFILSYYSEQKINEYILKNKDKYNQFMEVYRCPFSLQYEPDKLREWTELSIFSIIRLGLESKFNKKCPWIIYDNTWSAQYNTKLNPMNPPAMKTGIHTMQNSLKDSAMQSKIPKIQISKELNEMYTRLTTPQSLSQKMIITPYHWPDLDGIASAYSLSQLLQKKGNAHAKSMIWKNPQLEAQWVMNKLGIKIPQMEFKHDEKFILVDVSDAKDIPSFIPLNSVHAIIDHRRYHDLKSFPNAFAWISPAGSAATLISQLYVRAEMLPDTISAKLLYLAIMSNTIKCKTHNTTEQDKTMVNWLKDVGDIDENVVDEMFYAKSSIKDIKQQLDDDLSSKLQIIDGKQTAVAQLEIVDVEDFLKKNKNEVLEALKLLKKERKAESIFLIAIDIKNLKTFFCFLDSNDEYLARQKISMEPRDYYHISDDVLTRKEVIAMLQECDNKKTHNL